MNIDTTRQQIDAFENHYHYDCSYIREMLDISPLAYEKFTQAGALSQHRELLDEKIYWLVKLAAYQSEDCGQCLQLNVRMALEAKIPKAYIETVLYRADELPADLYDLYRYVRSVAENTPADEGVVERVQARLSKGQLIEIGLSVASAKLYPAVKRALGYAQSCSLISLELQ